LHDLPIPSISICSRDAGTQPLSFPLTDPASIELVKDRGSLAPVGHNGMEVVQTDKRLSYQLLSHQIKVDGLVNQKAFRELLDRIQKDLGVSDVLQAHLYKFLFYEKDCFFQPHRDHERLPNMVGTLVLELPSIYDGGDVRVWPPYSPPGEEPLSLASGNPHGMSFAAFYADCYHEVTEVTKGSRCVLVFSLTSTPRSTTLEAAASNTLFSLSSTKAFASYIKQWESEQNADYAAVKKVAVGGTPEAGHWTVSFLHPQRSLWEREIGIASGIKRAGPRPRAIAASG